MSLPIDTFPFVLRWQNYGYKEDGDLEIQLTQKFEAVTEFGTIKIPSGFVSDGASIPKFAWSLVGHPFSGYLAAAIIHDYLYRNSSDHYKLTRKQADEIFYELLRKIGYSWIKAKTFYRSVRLAGWRSYKQK